MTTANQYDLYGDERARLIESILASLSSDALTDPDLPEIVNRLVDKQLANKRPVAASGPASTPRGDAGFAGLLGIGDEATPDLGSAQISPGVVDYDDTLKSDRILSTADLYYLYIHETIGVFRVVWKLQEEFRSGSLRISNGPGAFALYRFDKRALLRYETPERLSAYRRVLGYTNASPGSNARANQEFHGLFVHFISETAKFWRDKRISEVIRERATDPTFGSVSIVRRAGLDLRNNLKNSSYGWVNVMRIETLQALADAFRILDADDVKSQFGAETPWDTIELVMWQYFGQAISASAMNRMAVAGRLIIQWLAEPYVLTTDRQQFEAQLYQIAAPAEEWISSDEGMRLSRPTPPPRHVFRPGPPSRGSLRKPAFAGAKRASDSLPFS
jgi:hypothetical protein